MANYNIKDIEQLSGIKAHTLRIWEKRYGIIVPKRTDTNIRYYDDGDLKKILNISLLNRNGFKISKIAGLSNEQLTREIHNLNNEGSTNEILIGELIRSMIDFDEILFEKTFNKALLQIGFKDTILKIVYPFFTKIGILWLTDSIDPAQEHFISNLIRQKVISAIDSIPEYPNLNSETFVLFLQPDNWHEMGLLLSSYLIKSSGHKSIYLGKSLPIESVVNMSKTISFKYIVTAINYSVNNDEVNNSLLRLSEEFVDKKIFVGGLSNNTLNQTSLTNIIGLNNLEEFDLYLENLKREN